MLEQLSLYKISKLTQKSHVQCLPPKSYSSSYFLFKVILWPKCVFLNSIVLLIKMQVIFVWFCFFLRGKHRFLLHLFIYTFTGWFFSVPWLEIKSTSLKQNSLTNWAILARAQIWFLLKHFLDKFSFNLKFICWQIQGTWPAVPSLDCSEISSLIQFHILLSVFPEIGNWDQKLD